MVLSNEELIGKLPPEVRILPANDSPRCRGSESMPRGVAKPGNGGSRAQSGRDQGSDRPPARILQRVALVDPLERSARHDGDVWPEGWQGAWLT